MSPPNAGPDRVDATLIGSALAGALLAVLLFGRWTDNVESAMVVSGALPMRADNPMRAYHLSVVSALIDGAAVLLRAGLSTWTVSLATCAFQGALAFSSLSAASLVVTRSPAPALLAPFAALSLQLALLRVNENAFGYWPGGYVQAFHGHGYPIFFPCHESAFGVVGLYGALLAWSLLALRRVRAGALIAGLLPWFHPVLGAVCLLGAAAGATTFTRDERRRALLWGAAGLLPTALAVAAHRVMHPAPSPSALASELAELYVRRIDEHRRASPSAALASLEVDGYVIALLVALSRRGDPSSRDGLRFVSRAVALLCAVALPALAWVSLARDGAPILLLRVMPQRVLNLDSVLLLPLTLAALADSALRGRNALAMASLAAVLALLAAGVIDAPTVGAHYDLFPLRHVPSPLRAALFPVLGVGVALLTQGRSWPARGPDLTRALPLGAALFILAAFARAAPRFDRARLARGDNPLTPAMRLLARAKGQAIVYPHFVARVQLQSGRPVLLDPVQINFIPYVPAAATKVEEILGRVYGESLRRGLWSDAPGGAIERLWSARSVEEWQSLRRAYDVTVVLTPPWMRLTLRRVFESPLCAVYHIPKPTVP